MASQRREIMLVVGEASGDAHGAQLVDALHEKEPALKVYGVGGEQLQRTRFETLFSVAKLTGMGLVELAGNLKNLWRAYSILKQALRERRPNLLVLIDFPEFNLRLARYAKSLRIPVLYYVSPQIWAWRKGRVRQIARWVDRMAVIFPFEAPFYQRHGINATFVGHPLLETVKADKSREETLAKLGLDPQQPVIALLPGSRLAEISQHLPVMRDAAVRLRRERRVQFFCVRATTIAAAEVLSILDGSAPSISVVDSDRYNAVHAADLVWTASGTATLETALLGRPMIIVYRVSWLTYWIARWLVRVDHIGMVNLIAEERLMPELIQSDMNSERLAAETRLLLDDTKARTGMVEKLAKLRERLGTPGAPQRVADLALGMMR
ncbi:MAG TPA: lipid-A-disaccharide synthase [Candidatus Limnocylindrales bacterium]|nr:lipid-A-disaccharide synthase [Candidatus Limnocylindrales bacterium]